ncbi:MAG: hypothetical protein QG646_1539 [Euryarchaeota archaeon]|nr:hypothetical protein [Euryarchaeota archaeon]
MRLKLIIGILALLLLMVGTASAFELSDSDKTGATDNVGVFVTYNGNQIIFSVEERIAGLDERIDKIAFNIPTSYVEKIQIEDKHGDEITVYNVRDNIPEYWIKNDEDKNMGGGFGDFESYFANSGSGATTVTVTLTSSSAVEALSASTGYQVAAHAAWGTGSAYFAGPGTQPLEPPQPPDTEIPEFPTIAMPVAAILGLMFVFGRRKQE